MGLHEKNSTRETCVTHDGRLSDAGRLSRTLCTSVLAGAASVRAFEAGQEG